MKRRVSTPQAGNRFIDAHRQPSCRSCFMTDAASRRYSRCFRQLVAGDERDDFLLHLTDKSSRIGRINEPGPLIVYTERREVTVNIAPAINVPSKGNAPRPTNVAVLIMRFVIVNPCCVCAVVKRIFSICMMDYERTERPDVFSGK